MLLVGCGGDDDDTESAVTTAPPTETTDGDADGEDDDDQHDLAVGSDTPKDPKGRYYLHHGDRGPDVLTLQARLDQLGAALDEDDVFGDQTLHAVLQFQRSENLTPDGVVGSATWAALDEPAKEVSWTDPDLPAEHATTPPTGTVPAETTPATSGPAKQGDAASVPAQPADGGTWTKAVVTLSNETATFYDAAGNVVLQAPISSGKNGLTPTGTFHVQSKSEKAYAGGDSDVYMDWMTRFNGGIGFHSIPKHADGEDLPTPLGQQPVSHGCIRMADDQAKLVFENLPVGALVEVHE